MKTQHRFLYNEVVLIEKHIAASSYIKNRF